MENNYDKGSYHNILVRSGFIGHQLDDSSLNYSYYYIKRLASLVVLIDVYSSYWKVTIYSSKPVITDRLEVLFLDKDEYSNNQELQDDLDKSGLAQLKLLENRLNIDLGII